MQYAHNTSDRNKGAGLIRKRDAYINAMVYSNYSEWIVEGFVNPFLNILKNRQASAASHGEDALKEKYAEIDIDRDIRCPVARAAIILGAICVNQTDGQRKNSGPCKSMDHYVSQVDVLIDRLNKKNICSVDLLGPLEHLLFSPVDMDLRDPTEL